MFVNFLNSYFILRYATKPRAQEFSQAKLVRTVDLYSGTI